MEPKLKIMAAVETAQIPLGFIAPDFRLLDVVKNQQVEFSELKGERATVIMFICNHCPYVKHIFDGLVQLGNDYLNKPISFIAISSNDVINYPDDGPEKMKELAIQLSFPFPYLYDETQNIAKAYHAECTPDFSIFDKDAKCVYRGQLDDSRPGNKIPVTGKDIRMALDAICKGVDVDTHQKPSIGCSIKWFQEK